MWRFYSRGEDIPGLLMRFVVAEGIPGYFDFVAVGVIFGTVPATRAAKWIRWRV